MAKSDPVLEAFDRRCLWEVGSWNSDTPSVFLARFQSTAASLGPDERITLNYSHEETELLKIVLADPQASKICALRWEYSGKEDVNFVIPLLINKCPELTLLQVRFKHRFVFDFVSGVLEHPSNRIKVLEMPEFARGSVPRFFATLGQSEVSALTLFEDVFPEFYQGLGEYLTKDLLVRLKLVRVSSELKMSLAHCTRLADLQLFRCVFDQPTAFPKSITKLVFSLCGFDSGFDWSFLIGSSVRELDFDHVRGVDGNQLGGALAVHLSAKGLDDLCFDRCEFVNETLAVVGVEIGRIKKLHIQDINLNDASVELVALTLQFPSSATKELVLGYTWSTMSSIKNRLVPALKHPNCNLAKLRLFFYYPDHEAATKAMEDEFHYRRALFALLQGQQVKRKVLCQLRRLPVEMFRLVGEVLM